MTERVVAIIQARMGSTRFPGKVLMPLAGKPILWHIIHRLQKCQTITEVVIATSDQSCDDALVDFAHSCKVRIFRGSEENVLQRFLMTARDTQADYVVRVTGDAPFVHPETIDLLVTKLLLEKAEYCVGKPGVASIHEGFSPFTREALERLNSEAADDPIAREHVSAYFKEHPDSFKIVHVDIDPSHHFSGARMSIDTPADLRFAETVYQRLGVPAGEADMAEVVQLLRKDPELLRINNHVYQKKVSDQTMTFIFRCDGSSEIGLGHVVRCLALAEVMRDKLGCGITFVMAAGEAGRKMVTEAGFPVIYFDALPPENSLQELVLQKQPDGLVLDIRRGLRRSEVAAIRNQGVLVVDIDDPTDLRLEADLAFYPPVPQVEKNDWQGFSGKLYIGWEWVILRPQFADVGSRKKENSDLNILVSMGGSDPAGLTETIVSLLSRLNHDDLFVTVVVGPGCKNTGELQTLFEEKTDKFRFLENVADMAELMAENDLAIVTFGVTAYELTAVNTPMILLCLDGDHFQSASVFVDKGVAFRFAVSDEEWQKEFAKILGKVMEGRSLLRDLQAKLENFPDIGGVSRIANEICGEVNG